MQQQLQHLSFFLFFGRVKHSRVSLSKHLWFLPNTRFSAAPWRPQRHTQRSHVLQWKAKPKKKKRANRWPVEAGRNTVRDAESTNGDVEEIRRERAGSVVCDWRWQPHIYLEGRGGVKGIFSPPPASTLTFFFLLAFFPSCDSGFYVSERTNKRKGRWAKYSSSCRTQGGNGLV